EHEHEHERGRELRAESVRAIRVGHGANCSSVGSVIDTLFLGATVGGAILAAVCAAMRVEGVTVVGNGARVKRVESEDAHDDDEAAS
ncbi:MAG: hypothetical protein JWP87_3092, partial [Labilithrix sp.]|nr:hypothetical protein [Labilithrix sp.]